MVCPIIRATAFLSILGIGMLRPIQEVDFSTHLSKGDAWKITSIQDFRMPGESEIEQSYVYCHEFKVLSATESGWRAECKTELMESRLGETVLPPAKGAMPLVEQIAIGHFGERAAFGGHLSDPIEFRLGRLVWFVGKGTSGVTAAANGDWSLSLPGDEGGSVPKANVSFHVLRAGITGARKAHWIETKFTEQETAKPITAAGTFVIDDRTGLVLQADISAKNAQLPGGDGQLYDLEIHDRNDLRFKAPN